MSVLTFIGRHFHVPMGGANVTKAALTFHYMKQTNKKPHGAGSIAEAQFQMAVKLVKLQSLVDIDSSKKFDNFYIFV